MGRATPIRCTAVVKVVDKLPHAPTKKTRADVEKMIACGLDQDDISYVLGCTLAELQQHYAEELDHGTGAVHSKVGAALLKNALKGDVNAQKFWLQARAKWVIPTKVEHSGEVAGSIDQKEKKLIIDSILQALTQGDNKQVMEQAAALMPNNPGTGRVQ